MSYENLRAEIINHVKQHPDTRLADDLYESLKEFYPSARDMYNCIDEATCDIVRIIRLNEAEMIEIIL